MPTSLLVIAPKMPTTRVPCQELFATASLANSLVRIVDVGLADPIAGIGRIRIPAVAVVGDIKGTQRVVRTVRIVVLTHEIIARQQPAAETRAQQIGMIEEHAGIDIGDHDAGAAGGDLPRRRPHPSPTDPWSMIALHRDR